MHLRGVSFILFSNCLPILNVLFNTGRPTDAGSRTPSTPSWRCTTRAMEPRPTCSDTPSASTSCASAETAACLSPDSEEGTP